MNQKSSILPWRRPRGGPVPGLMASSTPSLAWTCSAYKQKFWTYSAASYKHTNVLDMQCIQVRSVLDIQCIKYKMALACLQFTTLSRSWTLSCIAEHGQCQSMAWLGVDTVIHSALARELTEYSNSCLHMCLTLKRDKTDTNIEYTFTEIWFALSNTLISSHAHAVRYFVFYKFHDITIWTHIINTIAQCIAPPPSTGKIRDFPSLVLSINCWQVCDLDRRKKWAGKISQDRASNDCTHFTF